MPDVVPGGPPALPTITDARVVNVEALFRRQVPAALCEAIVRLLRDEYAAAPEMCKGLFARDQAREATSWVRRAGVESKVLALSAFPDVRTESLRSAGAAYYVSVDVGEFTLIAARATDPSKMVRKAEYRMRIALKSAQRDLFGDAPIPAGARYYALILHGSARGRVGPDFIVVRFPTADHRTYLETSIDLRREYAHLFAGEAAEQTVLGVEHIADTTGRLTLRPRQGTGTLGGAAADVNNVNNVNNVDGASAADDTALPGGSGGGTDRRPDGA